MSRHDKDPDQNEQMALDSALTIDAALLRATMLLADIADGGGSTPVTECGKQIRAALQAATKMRIVISDSLDSATIAEQGEQA